MLSRVLNFVLEMFTKRAYSAPQPRTKPPLPKHVTPRCGRSRLDNAVQSLRVRSMSVENPGTQVVYPLTRNPSEVSLMSRRSSKERTPARPTMNPGSNLQNRQSRVDLTTRSISRIRSCSDIPDKSLQSQVMPPSWSPTQGPLLRPFRTELRTPAISRKSRGSETESRLNRVLANRQSHVDLTTRSINRIRSCSDIPDESLQSQVMPPRCSPSQAPLLRRVRQEVKTPAIPRINRGSETESMLNRGLLKNDTNAGNVFSTAPLPNFRPSTSQESCVSFETCSEPAEDWLLPGDDLVEIERTTRSNRPYQQRIRHIPQEARVPIKCKSRIPVRKGDISEMEWRPNLQRQFRKCTLPAQRQKEHKTIDFKAEDEVIGDCIRPAEITNTWLVYRSDTMTKFEATFKRVSKKKHRMPNMIDSFTHTNWMHLAGVHADRDASMFKQFAGQKVVLSLGEYKSLLDDICLVFDCDYWDVLRKMATCQDHYMR